MYKISNIFYAKLSFLSTCFALYSLATPRPAMARQEVRPPVKDSVQVVGYGQQLLENPTGSVTTLHQQQLNQGLLVSPEQLLMGHLAGLQINSLSGAPGAGTLIRTQRAATLSGQTAPLVVLDGVPLAAQFTDELQTLLGVLSPHDIASVTYLKDAAAAGIYGPRGVNGVLLITSRRGAADQKLRVEVRSQVALSHLPRKVEVLSADQFRKEVKEWGDKDQQNQLGTASTDWQEEIFEKAVSHDQHLSVGGTAGTLPYRLSAGYLHQNGLLTNTSYKRNSAALTLNPSFLQEHVQVDVSLRKTWGTTQSISPTLINQAVKFNPTMPVYTPSGDLFEWKDKEGNPIAFSPLNPVGLLARNIGESRTDRTFASAHLGYRFHFLPALSAHVNWGYTHFDQDGQQFPALSYVTEEITGYRDESRQSHQNKSTEYYLSYVQDLEKYASKVEATVGYLAQKFKTEAAYSTVRMPDGNISSSFNSTSDQENSALFATLQYGFKGRYFLSASARQETNPLFAKDNKTFTSKAVGLGWHLSKEPFLKNQKFLSHLLLRASLGFNGNTPGYPVMTPAFNSSLTWEKTRSANVGIDVGLFQNLVTASLDIYHTNTDSVYNLRLRLNSAVPTYTFYNEGEVEAKGMEFSLQVKAVETSKVSLLFSFNASYSRNKHIASRPGIHLVTSFDPAVIDQSILINSPGYPINSFNVYRQGYRDGRLLGGIYEDINKDGEVNDLDRRPYQSVQPTSLLGFQTQAKYLNWRFDLLARAEIGANVYNRHAASTGYFNAIPQSSIIPNLSSDIYRTKFEKNQMYSDYYVQNASFLRLEYLSLGYDFGRVLHNKTTLLLTGTVQNAFVLTKYNGQDPEVAYGYDNILYPRARTFSLTLHVGI